MLLPPLQWRKNIPWEQCQPQKLSETRLPSGIFGREPDARWLVNSNSIVMGWVYWKLSIHLNTGANLASLFINDTNLIAALVEAARCVLAAFPQAMVL